jgi:histone H3
MARNKQNPKKSKGVAEPTKTKGASKTIPGAGVKKMHRFRPGTRAKMEIKHQQARVNALIPRLPMSRLCREIAQDYATVGIRFQKSAINALCVAGENEIISLLRNSNRLAQHAKRVTVFPRDLHAAMAVDSGCDKLFSGLLNKIEGQKKQKEFKGVNLNDIKVDGISI